MNELPTGTVSLLFSDIEGSTVLLSRLGLAYADALDGQRRVLRNAWAEHDGIELGTEGDSFFVAFPTAEDAVAAAAQAQRELAAFEWPAGEQVRVRMGIHTGTPQVHDGGYVGMDVHRAARIAGAAHGGQVVISSATAELVAGCLPEQVVLRDLGKHQLKDITQPEHLFQLGIEGLRSAFPALKTLGAASSLPRPATSLVGRDGEVAELTALLGSPGVRLVTLTGPGGTGKTRLGIAVAQQLVERFPDGVFFVPLAAVTTSDVMWTSIAEVLDVPPEGRMPPGFFDNVAHHRALFVLDNLEQIDGAETVVAELLEHAPQAVVIATSRRPVNVPGELQHAVPPLELPDDSTLGEVERSGAVQMFVQHARAVKASFTLTSANAAHVAAVCDRLDGLPLAIELAAARTKLLSAAALLTRLDKALDMTAPGSRGPSRQRTLRDTIAWSYDLLGPTQRAFFARLGVFAGGADLDAIQAVTTDVLDGADPLDLVADLVETSLVTITDDDIGEPRVGMLATIRVFALDQLHETAEESRVRASHARHYADLVEARSTLLESSADLVMQTSRWFEQEHDNIRVALDWVLAPGRGENPHLVRIGSRLCTNLETFWKVRGYFPEAQFWFQRAVDLSDQHDTVTARCLSGLAIVQAMQGNMAAAQAGIDRAISVSRMLPETHPLAVALTHQGTIALRIGQPTKARSALEEAISVARQIGDSRIVGESLEVLALTKASQGLFEQALEDIDSAIDLALVRNDQWNILSRRHNKACILRTMGHLAEAQALMQRQIPDTIKTSGPHVLIAVAEDYGCVLAELGQHEQAVKLLGAADEMRDRHAIPRDASQQVEIAEPVAKTHAALTVKEWDDAYRAGRNTSIDEALTETQATAVPATD